MEVSLGRAWDLGVPLGTRVYNHRDQGDDHGGDASNRMEVGASMMKSANSSTWVSRVLAGALIMVAVLVSYLPVLHAGYIIDDDNYVTANLQLRDLGGLKRVWSDLSATPQYYPLVFTSFWAEYQLWGAKPAGYHITNVLLHALNALLVWILLQSLGIPGAWLAAALFALHPVQVESVAWIAERKNVLSAALYFLSLLAYFKWRPLDRGDDQASAGPGLYLLSLVLFLLALLSKTATVTLPAVILLLVWWKRSRIRRGDLARTAPMFVMGLGLGLLTLQLEAGKGGASAELWDLSLVERSLIAGRAVWFYVVKLVWPTGLSFSYERWVVDAGAWWQYLYPVGVIAVLVSLWFMRSRIGRGPLVAVLFFIGTLAPTLGFLKVYFFRYSYVADHFQYIACLGLFALASSGVAKWLSDAPVRRRQVGEVLVGLVLVVLGVLSWRQTRTYESLEVLCLDTLSDNPTSWLANNNLGNIYMKRGEFERALPYFEVAQESAPNYVETPLNLAILKMNMGRYEEAIGHAARAIEIGPGYPYGYQHMGDALQRSGRALESIQWYRQALKRDPESTKALMGLGSALVKIGQFDEAIEVLSTVVVQDQDNAVALTNLGIALGSARDFEGAVRQFEAALRLDPGNQAIARNLELARKWVGESEPPGRSDQ